MSVPDRALGAGCRLFSVALAAHLGYPVGVALSVKQRQYLRGLAHGLEPTVQVGSKGIPEGVVDQIKAQLLAHELIKVRFNTESAVEPSEVAADLALRTRSELVQKIGRTLVLYRRHDEKPRIVLPKRGASAGSYG